MQAGAFLRVYLSIFYIIGPLRKNYNKICGQIRKIGITYAIIFKTYMQKYHNLKLVKLDINLHVSN